MAMERAWEKTSFFVYNTHNQSQKYFIKGPSQLFFNDRIDASAIFVLFLARRQWQVE